MRERSERWAGTRADARRALVTLALALCAAAGATSSARAAFPYPAPPTGVNPNDYSEYMFLPGGRNRGPNDLKGKLEFMYAATPEPLAANPVENAQIRADPAELGGVRGGHIVDNGSAEFPNPDFAWQTTTGRPDVAIAVLDSGIQWNDTNAMLDLRKKTRLNRGGPRSP